MKEFTEEELKKLDKDVLITLTLSMQGQLNNISRQLDFMTEQIRLMNQRAFGRKTDINTSTFVDENGVIYEQLQLDNVFNEAEAGSDNSAEPEITEIIVPSHRRRKAKGKRDADLENLPARIINHELSKEELRAEFPNGHKELPVQIYKRISIIPQTLIVDEHHVHIYASKDNDGTIVRAPRPNDLFKNSIATAALISTVMNAKFSLHQPLDRQSRTFKQYGVNLETNTLCNWVIRGAGRYLSLIYEELRKQLYDSPVNHADETPFRVTKDGRPANSKSYMWVYCSNPAVARKRIILYDYQTRKADHPREFLKGFSGVLVTDGYQVYHTIDGEREDLTVAGCWIHAKRGFSEITKSLGETASRGTIAKQAEDRISEIFHPDSELDKLSNTERKNRRGHKIKDKVDAFFVWAKDLIAKGEVQGQTAKALQYCINQETYLRVFITHGNVPMDNNVAEQAIRPFTLGRKNWVNVDTPNGAKASAIIYSIVETAKANGLKVREYLELIFTEMMKHQGKEDTSYIYDLLPWSKPVQKACKLPPAKS